MKKRIKIVFFAFGFSIHAKRRIEIFTKDPDFEVAVASTYDYKFENARNIFLTDFQFPRYGSQFNLTNILAKLNDIYLKTYTKFYGFLSFLFLLRRKVLKMTDLPSYLNMGVDLTRAIKHYHQLKPFIKEFNPDMIFLQTLLYPNYLSFILTEKIPTIITFWNGDVTWWTKWYNFEKKFKKEITIYGCQKASLITVNSQTAHNACLQYGVTTDKIRVLQYPGLDMSLFYPGDKSLCRQKLKITSKYVVLYPRAIVEYVNTDIFIESASEVLREYPDTLFILIGSYDLGTDYAQKCIQLAKDLGIFDKMRFIDRLEWEDTPDYYNSADVMVSNSSNDSLPNTMLESMACGVPVIMGDIPQIREWINEENGYLCPPRDKELLTKKIKDALADKDGLNGKYIENCLRIINENFNSKIQIEKIKNIVKNVFTKIKG